MHEYEIKAFGQLDQKQQEGVVEVFIEGFGHLMNFLKDKQKLKCLLATAFHPTYNFAYVENNQVLGILGIATNSLRPIKIQLDECIKLYGKFQGSVLCKQMNAVFQTQVVKLDTQVYVDILATTKNARGRGVATKLLDYACSLPDYKEYHIEVLSKNQNAKRLYEKYGFVAYEKKYLSILRLKGFGYPIKMKLKIR